MENFGPILWFIIIGALFYFMMRTGGCCGGGHGRGSDTEKGDSGHEHGKAPDTGNREKDKSEHKHGGC